MDRRREIYLLGFSVFSGIGPVLTRRLLDAFETAENAWHADSAGLLAAGLPEKIIDKFLDFRDEFSPQKYAEMLQKKQISFITPEDKDFPERLKNLPNCPFVLYCSGNKKLLNESPSLAVVGTRKITDYGRQVTEQFVEVLSTSGLVIVSGLAMGVDAVAHQTALDCGGKTIAVLGSGVDVCHPSSNRKLYGEIVAKNGLIVSEYPAGTLPSIGSFPARNRIIAGLTDGVLVTEGALDSGSLITADWAFQLGRPVFAVPGPVTSALSQGPYALLEKGGTLAITPEAILSKFGRKQAPRQKQAYPEETDEEKQVRILLMREAMAPDMIVRETGRPVSEISVTLSLMEMKGWVRQNTSGQYELA